MFQSRLPLGGATMEATIANGADALRSSLGTASQERTSSLSLVTVQYVRTRVHGAAKAGTPGQSLQRRHRRCTPCMPALTSARLRDSLRPMRPGGMTMAEELLAGLAAAIS